MNKIDAFENSRKVEKRIIKECLNSIYRRIKESPTSSIHLTCYTFYYHDADTEDVVKIISDTLVSKGYKVVKKYRRDNEKFDYYISWNLGESAEYIEERYVLTDRALDCFVIPGIVVFISLVFLALMP